MTAERLKDALLKYERALESGVKESSVNALFNDAEKLVPNAYLNDLYFYPEKERNLDDVVGEAIARQELWNKKGEVELLLKIRLQAQETIENHNIEESLMSTAEIVLEDVTRRLIRSGYIFEN